jgi:hypothetical protein
LIWGIRHQKKRRAIFFTGIFNIVAVALGNQCLRVVVSYSTSLVSLWVPSEACTSSGTKKLACRTI